MSLLKTKSTFKTLLENVEDLLKELDQMDADREALKQQESYTLKSYEPLFNAGKFATDSCRHFLKGLAEFSRIVTEMDAAYVDKDVERFDKFTKELREFLYANETVDFNKMRSRLKITKHWFKIDVECKNMLTHRIDAMYSHYVTATKWLEDQYRTQAQRDANARRSESMRMRWSE